MDFPKYSNAGHCMWCNSELRADESCPKCEPSADPESAPEPFLVGYAQPNPVDNTGERLTGDLD